METLFFIFSIIIGLGLLVYWFISLMVNSEEELKDDQEREMLDEIKHLIDLMQSANHGTKFVAILFLGGTVFSEAAVALINFPFELKCGKSNHPSKNEPDIKNRP